MSKSKLRVVINATNKLPSGRTEPQDFLLVELKRRGWLDETVTFEDYNDLFEQLISLKIISPFELRIFLNQKRDRDVLIDIQYCV